MFRTLDERVMVAGQIAPEDVVAAAERGVRVIVNNRPDGEEPGQPTGAEIEAAARATGLGYVHIPVDHQGFSQQQVQEMADALAMPGPVLAFCRSGTRSTYLWALASAASGEDPDQLRAEAANAGYDLTPLMGLMQSLRAQ
jgi:uncharacterized protein (TIGR01244 family)